MDCIASLCTRCHAQKLEPTALPVACRPVAMIPLALQPSRRKLYLTAYHPPIAHRSSLFGPPRQPSTEISCHRTRLNGRVCMARCRPRSLSAACCTRTCSARKLILLRPLGKARRGQREGSAKAARKRRELLARTRSGSTTTAVVLELGHHAPQRAASTTRLL